MENLIINKDQLVIVIDSKLLCDFLSIESNCESGGVLYGFKVKDKEEYIISGCTFPQIKDLSTYTTFQRNDSKHFKIVNDFWKENKYIMYFGDWHFHPVDYVYPSKQDYVSFNKICHKAHTSSKYIFNIIVSKKELHLFVFLKNSKKQVFNQKYLIGGE